MTKLADIKDAEEARIKLKHLKGKYTAIKNCPIAKFQSKDCTEGFACADCWNGYLDAEANRQLKEIVAKLKTSFEDQHIANDRHWEQIVAPLNAKIAEQAAEIERLKGQLVNMPTPEEAIQALRYLTFYPDCGSDFCFLATEGFENEVAEPDEGAGCCCHREQCRYANEELLKLKLFLAKLKAQSEQPKEEEP